MRTVAVILEARIDGFKKKMHEAGDAASNVGKGVKGAAKAAESEFEKLQDVALKNEQAWRDVSNTFAVVGAARCRGWFGCAGVRPFRPGHVRCRIHRG